MNPINPIVLLQWLMNESRASELAKQKGLDHISGAYYGENNVVTHKSTGDKLEPIDSDKTVPQNVPKDKSESDTKKVVDNITKPQNSLLDKDGGGFVAANENIARTHFIGVQPTNATQAVQQNIIAKSQLAVLMKDDKPILANTPEGRKEYLTANSKAMTKIAQDLNNSGLSKESEAVKVFAAAMTTAKTPEELHAAYASLLDTDNKPFQQSVMKNVSEVYLHSIALLEGKEAYMPTSGTFPIADFVIIERDTNSSQIISVGFSSVKSGQSVSKLGAASGPSGYNELMVYSEDIELNKELQTVFATCVRAASARSDASESQKEAIALLGKIDMSKLDQHQAQQITSLKALLEKTTITKNNVMSVNQSVGRFMLSSGRKFLATYQGVHVDTKTKQVSIHKYGPCETNKGIAGLMPRSKGRGKGYSMNWYCHPNFSCELE